MKISKEIGTNIMMRMWLLFATHVMVPLSIRMARRNGQSMEEAKKQSWVDFLEQGTNRRDCLTLIEFTGHICAYRETLASSQD